MISKHKKTIYGILVFFLIMAVATMAHAQNTIKFGYIGPTKFIIGQECALTADMAVEDINKAGGIKIGNKKYKVELVKVDSNEILNVARCGFRDGKTDNCRQGEFYSGRLQVGSGPRDAGGYCRQEGHMDQLLYRIAGTGCKSGEEL